MLISLSSGISRRPSSPADRPSQRPAEVVELAQHRRVEPELQITPELLAALAGSWTP